jgi:hypothetical protein
MTQLLQQALAEIQKLPAPEQDAMATLILDELADECFIVAVEKGA